MMVVEVAGGRYDGYRFTINVPEPPDFAAEVTCLRGTGHLAGMTLHRSASDSRLWVLPWVEVEDFALGGSVLAVKLLEAIEARPPGDG